MAINAASVPAAGVELSSLVMLNQVTVLQSSDATDPIARSPFIQVIPNPAGVDIAIFRMLFRLHLHNPRATAINQLDIVVARVSDGMLLDGTGIDWDGGVRTIEGTEVDRNYWPNFFKLGATDSLAVQLWYFSDRAPQPLEAGAFAAMAYAPLTTFTAPSPQIVSVEFIPNQTGLALIVMSDGTMRTVDVPAKGL